MATYEAQLAKEMWDFALHRYAQPGVEALCLELQDRYRANVNIVLCCLWLQQQNILLTERLLQNLQGVLRPWQDQVVLPLRQVRRHAKLLRPSQGERFGGANQCEDLLKQAEIEAECHEYTLMSKPIADSMATQGMSTESALAEGQNLALYLNQLGIEVVPQQWIAIFNQA